MSKFYVTTAIDYTNDVIHIGHAYQKILADCIARYHRIKLGKENVFFLTGTDEHGRETEKRACELGISAKEFVDDICQKDKKQLSVLNISYDRFIRTSDEDHKQLVKEFWLRVKKNNPEDIYLGKYKGLYCENCESFITEKELVDGKCPYHPTIPVKRLIEENYFFRWSKYQQFLTDLIIDNPLFIKPESRRQEMLSFVKMGISDIPISRPGVRWGIPVPDNSNHTVYVWFDALINYISGAPEFWPATLHLLGKDNIRWHALLWPAMLKSAGFPLPEMVYGHDFLTLNGKKISKTLGNIIRPTDLVDQFGTDTVRYFFLRYGPLRNDVDISVKKIVAAHNADLANGLGNLVSRVAKLCATSGFEFVLDNPSGFRSQVIKHIESYQPDLALAEIWKKIGEVDVEIEKKRAWELSGNKLKVLLTELVAHLQQISHELQPFLPETAEKILKQFEGPTIAAAKPLFPRL